jgi:hypothetical protein
MTDSSASLSIVLLASPVRLRRLSSITLDGGRPRPPRCNPEGGGVDTRGSEEELRLRLDMIELTLPPPRGGREPRGGRMRDVSPEVARESEARWGFSGASSPGVTAGELARPGDSGEEEFEGERTRGLPLRPGFGRGDPLLRRLGVGVGGETLTCVTVRAGTGVSDSDSGGGEVKAGLGGNSSSSGGGDLNAGRGGTLVSARRVAGIGTGATNGGSSGTGGSFIISGGGGGGGWSCGTGGVEIGAGSGTGRIGGGGGTGGAG